MLTYLAWLPLMPTHRLVVCIRHPLDVARSLERRDGMTLEQGLELWATYNQRLLGQIPSDQWVRWVDFDEGAPAIDRLVSELDGDWGMKSNPEARSHYDALAHHHRAEGQLPLEIARLYEELKARANVPRSKNATK